MAWLRRFGACGFAHVQGPPVGAAEGSGDALLSFEDPAKCGPTRALAVLAQASTNHLHALIRDHGDEQMAFGDGPSDGARVPAPGEAQPRGHRRSDNGATTKSQPIARIARKQSHLVECDVALAVNMMLGHMTAWLAGGGRIEIRGF